MKTSGARGDKISRDEKGWVRSFQHFETRAASPLLPATQSFEFGTMDIVIPIVATNVAALLIIGSMAFGSGGRSGPRGLSYVDAPAVSMPAASASVTPSSMQKQNSPMTNSKNSKNSKNNASLSANNNITGTGDGGPSLLSPFPGSSSSFGDAAPSVYGRPGQSRASPFSSMFSQQQQQMPPSPSPSPFSSMFSQQQQQQPMQPTPFSPAAGNYYVPRGFGAPDPGFPPPYSPFSSSGGPTLMGGKGTKKK